MTIDELTRELRAARPQASPALRLRVREIVERGPTAARGGRAWRRRWLMALPAAAVLAVATAGVVGIVRPEGREAIPAPAADATLQKSEEALGRTAAPEAAPPGVGQPGLSQPGLIQPGLIQPGASAAVPGGGLVDPAGRAQRVAATLTLEVPDAAALSGATQRALRITRDLDGFATSVSYAAADTGVASLTLRVPSATVHEAIARLSQLGEIVSQQVQVDDLQEGLDELRSLQRALRARIARLDAQLAAEGVTAGERSRLEARRRAARVELAAATSSARQTLAQARLATLQLGLQTDEGSAAPPVPSRLDRTLDRALDVLAWEAVAALFLLVVAAPLLLAAFVAALWRARRETSLLRTG
jgi:hypothetical protein